MLVSIPPRLPNSDFPLRPHKNGHWYKSVWNRRLKRSEQFYFGSWHEDPKGERAMIDPEIGWLARRDGIRAGIDNVNVRVASTDLTLGELMGRFLTHKRAKCDSHELAMSTLGGYLTDIPAFVAFMKPGMPASGLKPEHFTAYMNHLVVERKLGRFARKRIRAYITSFLRFGVKNGWITMPNTGSDWVAPATDPDSMRQARSRAGARDYSSRILDGKEVDRLLDRAQPAFKAMILLGVNCGLGPADIGRLRWNMIDLTTGRLQYPRPKTGVLRVGYLWKKTRAALYRVRELKHNREALLKNGDESLVFLTRKSRPYYREREVFKRIIVEGKPVMKLTGIAIDNAVSITFGRMTRELGMEKVGFYRLRHTLKTIGKKARDSEALNLMMGHRDSGTGRVYDHEEVNWKRIKRVARVVYRRLWPTTKRMEDKIQSTTKRLFENAEGDRYVAA